MAIFAAGSNQAIDFTSLDVADLVDGEITIATPTRIVVSQTADDYLEATGSFNVSNPEAITGTITGFVLVRGGDTIFTLTGASITVANFIALAETGNPDALLAQIFSGNDSIAGSPLDDHLKGYVGNDTLDGGGGADRMEGGAGNDRYVVDDVGDDIDEAAGGGTDLVLSEIDYELGANLENLTLTGDDAIDGTGNALVNLLVGNDKDNVLDGGASTDKMSGGKGDDTYVVDVAGDVITELKDGGDQDTVRVEAALSYVLGAELENLILDTAAKVNGTGNPLDNELTGGDGDNVLDGKAGADTMLGRGGSDTYVVDNADDEVDETGGDGTDLVQSSVSFTLADGVENLTLTGAAAINGTGNGADNAIVGNGGANLIDGKAGADKMTGGAGNDIYVVDNAGDQVVELAGGGTDEVRASVALAGAIANAENYSFTGAGPVTFSGDAAANRIAGTAANDTFEGGGGNDTLDGGEGEDSLSGGLGNDLYVLTGFTEQVAELAGGGTDLVQSLQSYTLTDNVENLTLTGDFDNRTATGNALANLITGSGGNDTLAGEGGNDTLVGGANNDRLDGGAGNDKLVGGAGNDTYVVDAGDSITELAGEGDDDTVIAGFSYVLGTELENLILTGTDHINGTGNAKGNTLTGNGNNNVLDGKAGADEMIGGDGDDTYIIDNVKDSVTESFGEGEDLVQTTVSFALSDNIENLTLTGAAAINGTGNDLDNVIFGNTSANVLTGGAGDDRLNGRAGADTMHGGLGDDTYVVDDSKDVTSESGGGGTDTVESSVTFSLVDGIENLVLTGSGAINGIGNGLGNEIGGNSGANALWGLAGADSIDGGGGNDTLTGGSGDDVIDVGNGNDVVRYTNDIDGHDVIDNFDGDAVGGQDVFSLDALFDEFEIATADRAGRVDTQIVGGTVEVRVNLDDLAGFELFAATLNTADAIAVGTDVVVGTL